LKRATAKQQQQVGESGTDPQEEPDEIEAQVPRSERHSVKVRLGGKEYRLRSDASEEAMQQVADYVEGAMQRIRERTDTVDSQDVALLASLNLAREVLYLREQAEAGGGGSGTRLRALIEQVEAELPAAKT